MFDNIMMGAFVLFLIWVMIGFFEQMERRKQEREEKNKKL
jgi:nitroreductase